MPLIWISYPSDLAYWKWLNPATGGKPDFAGMMAGYTQFFGTTDQRNKPSRTMLQVVLPAASRGALVEIDLVAFRT
jgi:enamine deaminase RidA (YjgF/YER057c/UK114 family)